MRGAIPPLIHGVTHNKAKGEVFLIDQAQDGGQVAGCCEHGDEPSGSKQRVLSLKSLSN
jgi:hypothetical protein